MSDYHIYGLGAALVDTEIEVHDAELVRLGIEKGLMTLVDEARQQELLKALEGHLVHSRRAGGGSAANTIIAASYFGARTFYSCKVADDDHGHFYLQDLRTAGVATPERPLLPNGTTGKCLVLITPDAERSMMTYLGISESLSHHELDKAALASSQFLYLEGYLVSSETGRDAAIRAREHAERNRVKTALSFSDPGIVEHFRSGLGEMLGDGVDLLFCNRDEACSWAGTTDLDAAIKTLKNIAHRFAITLGADGALVHDGQTLHRIPPVRVKAVDTNGAGDMFAGAYLYGISQGYSDAEAGAFACRAASFLVTQYGPRLPGPVYQELLAAEHN